MVASNITYESFVLTWQGTGRFKVYVDGSSKGETVVNSFKVTGLDENTEYRVVVSSVGPSGEEQSTPIYVRTKQFVIEAPSNLQLLEVTHNTATVSWQHSNAEKYKVKIGGKEYETRNKSYNFSSLSENTSYDVSVAAYAKGKWSNYSSTLQFTTKRSKPNKVTGLSYGSLTHNSFTINWGYSDEQFTDPAFEIYLNGQKQTETKSKTYTFNDLEEQQSYQVYIVAKQNGAYSDKSEAITVKTTEFVVEVPHNLKVTDKMPTSATVLWSSSLSKFKLYLDGEEKETTSDKRVYLKALAPDTSYYVQVSAYDNGKWSELSEKLDFVTSEIPK
ncbi:fibronectin type III domain-containing protein, partial [Arthrospira platensis SPKY2]